MQERCSLKSSPQKLFQIYFIKIKLKLAKITSLNIQRKTLACLLLQTELSNKGGDDKTYIQHPARFVCLQRAALHSDKKKLFTKQQKINF